MPKCPKCNRSYVKEEGQACETCQALEKGLIVISVSGQQSVFKPKSAGAKVYWKRVSQPPGG